MIFTLFPKDIKEILRFKRQERFTDGWNENMMQASFDSGNYFMFGIKDGEKLIALISLTLSVDFADILEVLVDSKFRRQGYSTRLIAHALKFIKSNNVNKVFLEVRKNNVPAINSYKKSGFKEISIRKKYYDNGEDAIIMAKE